MVKFLGKFGISIICIAVALLPTWIYLLLSHVFNLRTLWQKFFFYGCGIGFIAGVLIQIIFIVILVFVFILLWIET